MDGRIPLTDVYVDGAIVDRAAEVLRSTRYVKGPAVEEFERAAAARWDVDHAVGVSSGTAALLLALQAAGVDEGTAVFVPAHTFFATASPALHLGADLVPVDVREDTFTMDPDDLREKVRATADPGVVVPVHVHGHPADMGAIREVADEYGLAVVEDACQAHGATYRGSPVGSLGDAGCFSFYPSKNATVGGDGGLVTTDDDDLARRVRQLRNHGRDESGEHVRLGLNHRLDEVKAAVGREQLRHLEEWNDRRREAARRYDERLCECGPVEPQAVAADVTPVYHHYAVRVPDRQAVRAALADRGVETGVHYPRPIHGHEPIARRLDRPADAPRAEQLCQRILSLPMHPRLSTAEVDRVCDALEAHYGGET